MKALIIFAIAVSITFLVSGLTTVPTGYVGVVYRGGRLLEYTLDPGLHVKLPIDSVQNVQVTMQVDAVEDVQCGTVNGVDILFSRIEVVNKLSKSAVLRAVAEFGIDYDQPLIFQRVAHSILETCASSTLEEIAITRFSQLDEELVDKLQKTADQLLGKGALEISSVRVSKPRLPESVRRAFESREAEKANLQVARERARVAEIEAQALAQQKEIASLNAAKIDQIAKEQEATVKKMAADTELYVAKQRSEANKLLYSGEAGKEFAQIEKLRALSSNTKIYYGEKLPSFHISGEQDSSSSSKK